MKMHKVIIYILLILLTAGISVPMSSQTADTLETKPLQKLNLKNPVGEEFWLCFQRNYRDPKRKIAKDELLLELFITGDFDANVVITIEGIEYREQIFVPAGTMKSISLPHAAQVKSEGVIEKLAVHITADSPISVYGLNRRYQTTDTFLGMPESVLGTEYMVMCYNVTVGYTPQFAIVATENNTNVEIIPTALTSKQEEIKPFTIRLNQGEVYQVTGVNDSYAKTDLTGSKIIADKKIAVFSGHQCAYVPINILACNHLVEQLPPISSWGKHFYMGMLQPRTSYSYRVLAAEPNTRVFADTSLIATLDEGSFYEGVGRKNMQISANKPVLVAQYSQGFRNGDSIGDPMMLLVSPTLQFLQKYRFATPVNGAWKHYVNVVVPTKAIKSLRLDGLPLDSKQFQRLGLSRYSIAYIKVPFGSHILECDMPFGMYSYGFGYGRDAFDAYGTMGGQSFIEYEPFMDSLPPTAELAVIDKNRKVIISDDRLEDLGLRYVTAIRTEGIDVFVPDFTEGQPQTALDIKPMDEFSPGRAVIEAVDAAMNKSIYTLCWARDGKSDNFVFSLNEGIEESCDPDPGIWLGLFSKMSAVVHSADFSATGEVTSLGRYSDALGFSGLGGIYLSRHIYSGWNISGRLSFEYLSGTLESPDSSVSQVRTSTGELKSFQESRQLELRGMFMNAELAAEYNFNYFLYGIAGIKLNFCLDSEISYERLILRPDDVTYADGKRITPGGVSELSSLNTMNLALFGGIGFKYEIGYRFGLFLETHYSHFMNDIINDGTWKIQQYSVLGGIKYRL